jgi:hypothetical protein
VRPGLRRVDHGYGTKEEAATAPQAIPPTWEGVARATADLATGSPVLGSLPLTQNHVLAAAADLATRSDAPTVTVAPTMAPPSPVTKPDSAPQS